MEGWKSSKDFSLKRTKCKVALVITWDGQLSSSTPVSLSASQSALSIAAACPTHLIRRKTPGRSSHVTHTVLLDCLPELSLMFHLFIFFSGGVSLFPKQFHDLNAPQSRGWATLFPFRSLHPVSPGSLRGAKRRRTLPLKSDRSSEGSKMVGRSTCGRPTTTEDHDRSGGWTRLGHSESNKTRRGGIGDRVRNGTGPPGSRVTTASAMMVTCLIDFIIPIVLWIPSSKRP